MVRETNFPLTALGPVLMEIRFLPMARQDERTAPPGEWHVRAVDERNDSALAKLALEVGPSGFVGGDQPNPRRLIVIADPTLDDMLAALFLSHELPKGAPAETAAMHFARYAESVRKGFSPTKHAPSPIPIERTLEAVFEITRHLASNYQAGQKESDYDKLTAEPCRLKFLKYWERLAALIMRKIAAGVDPHLEP